MPGAGVQPFSLKHLFNNHPWIKMTSWNLQDPDEASASWSSIEIRKKHIENAKKSSIALPSPKAAHHSTMGERESKMSI